MSRLNSLRRALLLVLTRSNHFWKLYLPRWGYDRDPGFVIWLPASALIDLISLKNSAADRNGK
jgi:hypothetical protein